MYRKFLIPGNPEMDRQIEESGWEIAASKDSTVDDIIGLPITEGTFSHMAIRIQTKIDQYRVENRIKVIHPTEDTPDGRIYLDGPFNMRIVSLIPSVFVVHEDKLYNVFKEGRKLGTVRFMSPFTIKKDPKNKRFVLVGAETEEVVEQQW